MLKNILYRFAFSKILVIFLCAALLGGITISLANDAFAFVKKSQHITFSLDEPASLYDISNLLQDSGVIENAFGFWIYVSANGTGYIFEDFHGSVELDSAMSYRDILNKFKNI